MKYLILISVISVTLISCSSSDKKKSYYERDLSVNDCAYFRKQKILILEENESDFIMYSEIDHMKFVYSAKKEKVKQYAIKVKCKNGKHSEVRKFLENHY